MPVPYYESPDREIEHSFSRHQRKDDAQGERFNQVMNQCKFLCDVMIREIPDCRERRIAIERIEEAQMWANKGIARHT